MSDFIAAKLIWGLLIIVAAGVYGFWRGLTGRRDRGDEQQSRERR